MKIGVKAFVIYEKKVLLILRDNISTIPYPNTWNLPGGGVEEGEDFDTALRRELMEEIDIAPVRIVCAGSQTFSDGKSVVRYFIRLTREEFTQLKLGDEGQEMRFFSLDETGVLPFSPYLGDFISENKNYLKEIIENNVEIVSERLGLELRF